MLDLWILFPCGCVSKSNGITRTSFCSKHETNPCGEIVINVYNQPRINIKMLAKLESLKKDVEKFASHFENI